MVANLEKRRLGRTGHMSTVAIFGGAAFSKVTQPQADAAMERHKTTPTCTVRMRTLQTNERDRTGDVN